MRDYKPIKMPEVSAEPAFVKAKSRRVAGVDVFVEANVASRGTRQEGRRPAVKGSPFDAQDAISSRGTQVYPPTGTVLDVTDMYRCRFMLRDATGDLQRRPDCWMLSKRSARKHRVDPRRKAQRVRRRSRAGPRPRARIELASCAACADCKGNIPLDLGASPGVLSFRSSPATPARCFAHAECAAKTVSNLKVRIVVGVVTLLASVIDVLQNLLLGRT